MNGKLLAKNILCALGIGVFINLGVTATAYANENQDEHIKSIADDIALEQRQLERIKRISQEIADINIRLSQLTRELNQYNEELLNNIRVENNLQIDVDNTESFNKNRQLEKRSKISRENMDDFEMTALENIEDESIRTATVVQDSADSKASLVNSSINENEAVDVDNNRKNMALTSDKTDLQMNETENGISSSVSKKPSPFVNAEKDKLNYGWEQYKSENADVNRDIFDTRQTEAVKIEKNEAAITNDDEDVVDFSKKTMLERFNMSAPVWTYEYFSNLNNAGLLYPDKDFDLTDLNRREGAILTARSYNLYKIQSRRNQYDTNGNVEYNRDSLVINDINILMKEFAPEVKALGYDIISEVSNADVAYKMDYDWKIGGEIRYNYARYDGSPKYDWKESRVRARMYGQKAISDKWKINAMIESDHNFIDGDNPLSSADNDDFELDRLYLEGQMNWWDIPFVVELGKTYAYLADGNILDSDFEGLKIRANPDANTLYSAGYGQVNDSEDMFYLEAYHKNRKYDYQAGFYDWDNYGEPTNIYTLGMNYYTGNFRLGGMYLKSNREDGSGNEDGYVLSIRYKEVFPWIPHTYEIGLKYYNMAGNTYINHTMNGVGSYMNGFSGWGATAYYTLAENWLLGLEYYDLKDKTTNEKGRTIWSQLSWFF